MSANQTLDETPDERPVATPAPKIVIDPDGVNVELNQQQYLEAVAKGKPLPEAAKQVAAEPEPAATTAALPEPVEPAAEQPRAIKGSLWPVAQANEPPAPTDLRPKQRLQFQVKGQSLIIEAYFHKVIRNGFVLALVFDDRAAGYPRVIPQAGDDDIAVYIPGTKVLYRTKAPGIDFQLDNYKVAVLLITEELPAPSDWD